MNRLNTSIFEVINFHKRELILIVICPPFLKVLHGFKNKKHTFVVIL